MKFSDFKAKHNGKFLEVAGSSNALNQCVDCVNGYIRDILKLPIIEWTNAKDFPAHPIAKEHFTYIKNTPTGIPEKGDIIVWGSGAGAGYGHIAIFIEGDANKFKSYDQNYPIGSPCHTQGHYYTNVMGWLRKKEGNMNNELKECFERERIHLKQHNELVDKCNKMENEAKTLVGQAEELKNTISKQATELTGLKKENKSLDSKLEDVGDKLISAEALREKWLGLYKQSQSNFDSCKIDLTNCKTKVTNLEKEEIPDNKYLRKLYYLVKEWDKTITRLKDRK